ncbi:hypothetical protein Tco_1036274 [Tanacetum coccineum]
MASQDTRLSKFEADFKQQQSEMTNKIDTVFKAITDRITITLPIDTVKNPKLNVNSTSLVLSARSCPTEDPQCSTQIYRPKNKPQLELKDPAATKKGSSGNDKEKKVVWIDVEEPLDLIDTSKEPVYESLIKEMPRCSLNYDFKIRMGDPRNLKIPCMIGHKFMANAYIDVDLPMNIMDMSIKEEISWDSEETCTYLLEI